MNNCEFKKTPDSVLEDLVGYIHRNGVQRSIKPVYKTPEIAIYNDDCFEVLSKFPDDYVDMIFADPPYNLSNNGITCHAGKMVSVNKGKWDKSNGFESDVEFHEKWISECRRVLKPSGTIWISGTNHSIYQCGFLLLGKHPTQKPLALLKRIVVASINENSIVLDPFKGRGTIGVSCNNQFFQKIYEAA